MTDRAKANIRVIFALTLVHFTGDFYGSFISPLLPLLVDQEVYPENLAQLGRNEAWLDTDLARRGMRRAEVLAYLGNKESCVVIQKKTAQNGRSEKPESTGGF